MARKTEDENRDTDDTQEAADIGRLALAGKGTDDLLTAGVAGTRALKFLAGTTASPNILKLVLHVDDLPGYVED